MSIVSGIKLLETLSSKEKEDLSLFCQKRELEPGEILFKEWEEASVMYILVKGSMEVYNYFWGKEVQLGKVHAEEILWEMALFWENSKRMATARAIDECQVLAIMSFSIKELTVKYPDLLSKIKNIIEERIIDNKITQASL